MGKRLDSSSPVLPDPVEPSLSKRRSRKDSPSPENPFFLSYRPNPENEPLYIPAAPPESLFLVAARSDFAPLETVFCLFARPIFTIGEFSTTAPAQLQGFKKLQGYYREGRKREARYELTRKSQDRLCVKARPFMRKLALFARPFMRG